MLRITTSFFHVLNWLRKKAIWEWNEDINDEWFLFVLKLNWKTAWTKVFYVWSTRPFCELYLTFNLYIEQLLRK